MSICSVCVRICVATADPTHCKYCNAGAQVFLIFYALCVCVSVNCVFGFDAFFVMFCVGVLLFCWWFCVLFAVCICRSSVMMLCCLLCAVAGNCLLLQLVCSL